MMATQRRRTSRSRRADGPRDFLEDLFFGFGGTQQMFDQNLAYNTARHQYQNLLMQQPFLMQQLQQQIQAQQVQSQLYNAVLSGQITPDEYMSVMGTIGVNPSQVGQLSLQRDKLAQQEQMNMLRLMLGRGGLGGLGGTSSGGSGGGGDAGEVSTKRPSAKETQDLVQFFYEALGRDIDPKTKQPKIASDPDRLKTAIDQARTFIGQPHVNPVTWLQQTQAAEADRQAYLKELQDAQHQVARTDIVGGAKGRAGNAVPALGIPSPFLPQGGAPSDFLPPEIVIDPYSMPKSEFLGR